MLFKLTFALGIEKLLGSLLCLGCVAHWTAEGDIEAVIDDRVHVLDCYLFVISNEVVHELWRDRVFLGTHRWLRGQSWCTSRQQQWNNRAWYSKSHINTNGIQRQTTMNRPNKTPSWFEDLLSLSTTTELHTFLEVWASFALPPIPIILLCTFTCASRMLEWMPGLTDLHFRGRLVLSQRLFVERTSHTG